MKKYQIHYCLIFISAFIALFNKTMAQRKESVDNGYYITYPDRLMLNVYLSQKFAPFTISSANEPELNYKTNSKLNLGAGFAINGIGLNLSYGFKFLNKEKGKGTTKGLDFQFHLYPHKWAVDLLGTFRKGYYLDPKNNNDLNLTDYYRRPDLKRNIAGLSVFRVPNSHKFSYRAALTQNDWQTKSAGSLLFGGEAYYGSVKGDSALVPVNVSNNYDQAGIDRINFFSIGPGIGYAYTLVISKNFFITGSAIGSIDLNFSGEEKVGDKKNKVSVIPGGVYKGAIGYNSDTWSVSANITGNALYVGSESSSKEYFLPTGGLRFIVAKKLAPGPRK
ncbi:MAG: DUF4421 domain-containing protein [Bacteroidota bacterium]|nr:DUF4421 domain-containing protein [Bacteroidota bacterium]